MTAPPPAAWRRCVLAATVRHEVDALAGDDAVTLPGRPAIRVDWADIVAAAGAAPPDSDVAADRLARWLRWRRWVGDHPTAELPELARPVALPRGHVLHPGATWVQTSVAGGVLDVGIGFRMSSDIAETTYADPPPAGVLAAAGLDDRPWWPAAAAYLEQMAELAVARYARDPDEPLRPMGDCDSLTLLASSTLRRALVAGPAGMRPVAVPVRNRGWLDLRRTDVAFARAAAMLTAADERGLDRPALLTADELSLPPDHGDLAGVALRDPPAPDPWWGRNPLTG